MDTLKERIVQEIEASPAFDGRLTESGGPLAKTLAERIMTLIAEDSSHRSSSGMASRQEWEE